MGLRGQRIAAQTAADFQPGDFRQYPVYEGPKRAFDQRQFADPLQLMEHQLQFAMLERRHPALQIARQKYVDMLHSSACPAYPNSACGAVL